MTTVEPLTCPRCPEVTLLRSPGSTAEITFLECPSCQRWYAKKPGAPLTYRWGHPVTLALYSVIFDRDPVPQAKSIARGFLETRGREVVARMADEIEFELNQPTQRVRDALDSVATEEKCREFLKAFVSFVRSRG